MTPERIVINCACKDPDHLLVLEYYKDEFHEKEKEDPFFDSIYVHFTSKYYESIWQRIKIGLKYITKGKTFPTGDSVLFTHNNIAEVEHMILFLKDRTENYINKIGGENL